MKSTRVKICGITNREDAELCVDEGADALGFVLYDKSPRSVDLLEAMDIIKALPPFVTSVAVVVDKSLEGLIEAVKTAGFDAVQLHGTEDVEYVRALKKELPATKIIKAFRVRNTDSLADMEYYDVSAYLLDAYDDGLYGGTGKTFNWDVAGAALTFGRIILAGGLSAENIKEAIETVHPDAVDLSSGLEREPGRKDPEKVKEFFKRMRGI